MNLKLAYSEYQLEQLVKQYLRVAATTTELGEQKVNKSLIGHFTTSSSNHILEADFIETEIVGHFLVYGVRKVSARRMKRKRVKPKIVKSRKMIEEI